VNSIELVGVLQGVRSFANVDDVELRKSIRRAAKLSRHLDNQMDIDMLDELLDGLDKHTQL